MAAQFDFNAGFDPSALTDITQAQLLQMIQQLAPLSNIGGVIFGTTAPDVTNNARFKRYIWLDSSVTTSPPVPKYYDIDETAGAGAAANWTAVNVAALSITNAEISATAEIAVSKLADGAANEVIRTDAAGTGVEWVTVATLLAALNDSVPLTAIDDTAAVGATSFLRRDGSTVVWKTFAETVTAIQAALNAVAVSVLAAGTNGMIVGTAGGTVVMNTPANILANEAITLALLAAGGGSALQVLARNSGNTAWSPQTPALNLLNAATVSTTGILSGSTVATAVHTIAHGLGAIPKLIDVRIRLTGAGELGYSVNDEVSIAGYTSGGQSVSVAVVADATNITLLFPAVTGNLPRKDTAANTAVTEASWTPIVRAWL